ncbi:WhiB family transcriptional regulator [Gordonia amicalis]|uniref:WhiB family transcriptional regulator n=1 Tax=Gordonia amicalis TaxID=89053 RepID=UPI0024B87FD6|nr:WhiB family transcriptional regulator [Gordonia amicalis]MDJ0454382.1 WhiB family transcriptional regulator [Gordonia amicalis]MDV7077729.1 WhiB family transcriptional regulator [Gordonia amicalis]
MRSNGFYIESVPTRSKPARSRTGNTIDEKKQAIGSTSTIPGSNLLNRNRNVSDLLADIPRPPDWHEGVPCSTADPDAFFPTHYNDVQTADAKRICAACDVRTLCLQWALDNREEHGVLGGTTPRDRQRIRKEQGAA